MPVIASGYSGNLDILLRNNKIILLVDYDLIQFGRERLKYRYDDIWAEPNIDNAKEKMIQVRKEFNKCFDEPLEIGEKLRENFSLNKIGKKMLCRINSLMPNA